jgi:hypothetical protein
VMSAARVMPLALAFSALFAEKAMR